MFTERVASSGEIFFDRFCLNLSERLLTLDDQPVEIGGRALDILIQLACNPDAVLSKADIMDSVWPDITVEESTLRFHMSNLRKALGDGVNGARFIVTVAGRGYRFVVPVRSAVTPVARVGTDVTASHLLPPRISQYIGRRDGIHELSNKLISSRFVTIIGPGGVGKTTLALAVAHEMLEPFVGRVLFLDLGMLDDPSMVPTSLASTLGIAVRSIDPTPSLVTFLRNQRILLVLDNCEHVVESVAAVTTEIFNATPQVYLLTTSREALRVAGESVFKLDPLEVPPDGAQMTAEDALAFPAAQLFMERAKATGARIELTRDAAGLVSAICRKLDGVALAIELAAGRVEALGLRQTAELLDQHLSLSWPGRRSAPGRQRTLQATLDWSYELLLPMERVILRCVAVFSGHFTLDGAIGVAPREIAAGLVIEALENLVAKSMVASRQLNGATRYRLLATTRAYVIALKGDPVAGRNLSRRHAEYCIGWLENNALAGVALRETSARARYLDSLNDVRSALEWCFGQSGDQPAGIRLAARAAPIFLGLSLLGDCYKWCGTAIRALGTQESGSPDEMHLQAAFGLSVMFTRGSNDDAREALNRSLAIAEKQNDIRSQLQLLAPLTMYHLRIGDFRTAIELGRNASRLSKFVNDPGTEALAHSIIGISLTHTGDLAGARAELEAAHQNPSPILDPRAIYLGFDGHDLAGIFLAKTLWLQGFADRARSCADETISDAFEKDHPVTLSIALIWAISLYIAMEDVKVAQELLDQFTARAELHSLEPYLAAARAYRGLLAVRSGDAGSGVPMLTSALADLHAAKYELFTTTFTIALARGVAEIGSNDEALTVLGEAIAGVTASGDVSHMPDLLRAKGNLLMKGGYHEEAVEECLSEAITWSREQGAVISELAATIDLATLRQQRGVSGVRTMLQSVYLRLSEGFENPLVRQAERLLARLP
ncbi:ATP-binding protein [Rhizobium grahamii]|uniref:OmpR/PhoB-type domain-containing protein n=1 Tax=Rhizobium grahamii TaxID=1120045 RepID=A0A370KEH2_9HYPH|nr:winged helix-turn-helix domain-containing protein [Rhizobium grahamii]RDJ02295.1 hypothetical protein B5K06_32385 [Rhizobium grahamii]